MRLAGRISIFVVLYGCTAFAQGQWRSLGDVTSVEKLANGVELSAGAARVRITVLTPTVVRLRYSPQGSFGPDQSFAAFALGITWLTEGKPEEAKKIFPRSTNIVFRLAGAALAEHDLHHPTESQRALEMVDSARRRSRGRSNTTRASE